MSSRVNTLLAVLASARDCTSRLALIRVSGRRRACSRDTGWAWVRQGARATAQAGRDRFIQRILKGRQTFEEGRDKDGCALAQRELDGDALRNTNRSARAGLRTLDADPPAFPGNPVAVERTCSSWLRSITVAGAVPGLLA